MTTKTNKGKRMNATHVGRKMYQIPADKVVNWNAPNTKIAEGLHISVLTAMKLREREGQQGKALKQGRPDEATSKIKAVMTLSEAASLANQVTNSTFNVLKHSKVKAMIQEGIAEYLNNLFGKKGLS